MPNDIYYQIGFTLIALVIVGPIFFSPTIIAIKRRRRVGIVLFCNVFLGWTAIGWIAAMAIAVDDR